MIDLPLPNVFMNMRKRRKFYSGVVNHVYQRTVSGNNLFYGYEDFLTFFTILSVSARAAQITFLGLCLMYNHFHALIVTESVSQLSDFMNHACSWFAREFNHFTGNVGQLLKKNFGSAPKWSEKDVRTTINYVGNNPVEKRICIRPEQYRWNFLQFAVSSNPFSEPLVLRKASKRMKRAVKEVATMYKLNLPLKFTLIRRLFNGLTSIETEQLVDYIISTYNFIDYQAAISYYGSYEKMLEAMNSNTGSEYEIREEWDPDSDLIYHHMVEYVQKAFPDMPANRVTTLPEEQKQDLARVFSRIPATPRQISRFLHLPVPPKSRSIKNLHEPLAANGEQEHSVKC